MTTAQPVVITRDNAVSLLRQTIDSRGGGDKDYRARVADIYQDERTTDVIAAECYYVAPGIPHFVGNEEDLDYDWEPLDSPQPICLIGCLLVDLGVEPKWFIEHNLNADAVETILNNLHNTTHIQIERDGLEVLKAAQQAQDSSKTWGEALRLAEAVVELANNEETE